MKTVKNIIFDLGNVLLDLQLGKTEEAFRELLQEDFEEAYLKYESDRLFERLEVGKISPFEFVKGMRAATSVPLTDDDIVDAWNAMLLRLPGHRIDFLKTLSSSYRIFLLSNTNAVHMLWLDEHLEEQRKMNIQGFTALFEKHYFSFQLQMRKPEPAIFQHILKENDLAPAETLFIDDVEENIASAAKLGLQTYQHDPKKDITEVLPDLIKVGA